MYMVHNFIRPSSGFSTRSSNNFTKMEVLFIPKLMKMKIQNHKLFCVSNGYYLNKMQYSPIESLLWLIHGHKMTSPSLLHSSRVWSEKFFENVKLLTILEKTLTHSKTPKTSLLTRNFTGSL
jgi:hypothetical protein